MGALRWWFFVLCLVVLIAYAARSVTLAGTEQRTRDSNLSLSRRM